MALAGLNATTARVQACTTGAIPSVAWGTEAHPPLNHALFLKVVHCGGVGNIPQAWSEVTLLAHGMLNEASMRDQFECHAIFFKPPFPLGKGAFDLEPWRPAEPALIEDSLLCNPPNIVTVYGVGEGGGASATTQASFEKELIHSKGGGPPALGEPGTEVINDAGNCFQLYNGGWRANVGGADGVTAIVGTGCADSGIAHWIGDYFMGYLEAHVDKVLAQALSVIGFPITDSHRWGYGRGWMQEFSGGQRGPNVLVRADSQSAAHDVYGLIYARYIQMHGAAGVLGFPTTDVFACPTVSGSGMCQDFEGGELEDNGTTVVVRRGARFDVPGTTEPPGVASGVSIKAGTQILITATGVASFCPGCNTEADGGPVNKFDGSSVLASAHVGALLARIVGRKHSTGWLSAGKLAKITAPVGGSLYLLYNDVPFEYSNNGGGYAVRVSRLR